MTEDLCNQKKVNETFVPIKERLDFIKGDIEEIEFLFKNCWYNFNCLMIRKKEFEEGFKINPKIKDTIKKYEKLVPEEVVKFGNLTIYEDTLIFEFHSFLTNIIRTVDFWMKFNLKNKEGEAQKRWETIGQFLKEENHEKNKNKFYYCEAKTEYKNWISKINEKRKDIMHRVVEKRMHGSFSVNWKWNEENEVDFINNSDIGILDIENLKTYCLATLNNLENFIINYFKAFFSSQSPN